MLTASLIVASALLADAPVPTTALAKVFTACEYRPSGGGLHPTVCRYRLFVPPSLDPAKRYPLLVWLHGWGDSGDDNQRQLGHLELVLDDLDHPEKYNFFILATQWRYEDWGGGGRYSATGPLDDMIEVTAEILRKTMADYPVDDDRVYLAGASTGATNCWEMAMRYPELFTCLVSISSGGGDESRAELLAGIPVWAFHNANDTFIPPEGDKRMVAAVNAAGGSAELTLFRGFSHNAWTAAFRNEHAMQWILAQCRGSYFSPPPGYRPWHFWHVLTVPAVFLTVVWLAWAYEKRRRGRW